MLGKEDEIMAEEPSGLPPANTVVEMPWVLISNQIQQLSSQMNERFNDQRLRFEDRFDQVDKRFEQVDKRFEEVDKRFEQVDKRFEQVDKHFELLEGRLTFRNSTWLAIVVALLTLVLGALLSPKL